VRTPVQSEKNLGSIPVLMTNFQFVGIMFGARVAQYSDDTTGWTSGIESGILFTNMSRLALELTQPPIQWVLGSFPRGRVAGGEADYTLPSCAKVKNV